MSDKGRRTKSEEGPVPPEAETSLDIDPKLEKKVELVNELANSEFKNYLNRSRLLVCWTKYQPR